MTPVKDAFDLEKGWKNIVINLYVGAFLVLATSLPNAH